MKIADVNSQKILDSKGDWTLETEITLETGEKAEASVPSGTSKGKYETTYLEVSNAISNINKIIKPKLVGKDIKDQQEFDNILLKLDGTEDKSKLGVNTVLSLSVAFCKVSSLAYSLPLYQYVRNELIQLPTSNFQIPKLMTLIFEGGKHGDSELTIQEFMFVLDNLNQPHTVFEEVKSRLKEKELDTDTGLEGAYSPDGIDNEGALEMMKGYNDNIPIALDVAEASKQGGEIDYGKLIDKYPIISLEDPCGEEEWENWVKINQKIGDKVLIVGDDLTVSNPKRVRKAIKEKAINGLIIKPNQVGTVTETIESVKLAKKANIKIVVSHRSGETNDDFIADFAVGVNADYVKFGAPNRGERIAKYNRLLEIEQIINDKS